MTTTTRADRLSDAAYALEAAARLIRSHLATDDTPYTDAQITAQVRRLTAGAHVACEEAHQCQ